MCTSWAGDGGDSRAATPGVGVQKSKLGRGPSGFNSFTERRGATTRSFSGSAPSLPHPPPSTYTFTGGVGNAATGRKKLSEAMKIAIESVSESATPSTPLFR